MTPRYNTLGKICMLCVFLNLFLAWIMATNGNHIAILNILSAFACHIGSFSNNCRK